MAAASITLKNDLDELSRMTAFVQEFGRVQGLSEWDILAFTLAIEELITNTINYGFPEAAPGQASLFLEMEKVGPRIHAVLRDAGRPFNPLDAPGVDLSLPLEDRPIGGLGVHLVTKMMDHVSYEHRGGENVLSMDRAAGPC